MDRQTLERWRGRIPRRKKKELTGRRARVRRLTSRSLAIILGFFFFVALIWGLWALVSGSSLFTPRGADGILKSIDPANAYGWESSSIRRLTIAGSDLEQQATRGVLLDLKANKFQLTSAGVFSQGYVHVSDGVFTVAIAEEDGDLSQPGVIITDVCAGDPAIPASSVAMPEPSALLDSDPEVITDKGTFAGDRAWIISFKPSPELIAQMLMLNFVVQVSEADSEANWITPKSERDQIGAGEYTVNNAAAWINRGGDRQIQQIDIDFELDSGARYRVLGQRTRLTQVDPDEIVKNRVNLGDPGCERENGPIAGARAGSGG